MCMKPYSFEEDPPEKTIIDDATMSQLDFACLVACRPNVLIYRYTLHVNSEVYHPSEFCLYLGYNQHLLRVFDSKVLEKVTLVDDNVYWRECMWHFTNAARSSMPRISAKYECRIWTLVDMRCRDHLLGRSFISHDIATKEEERS